MSAVIAARGPLAREYAAGLESYCTTDRDESALLRAHDFGRRAWSNGFGVLDMALLHHEVLGEVLSLRDAVIDRTRMGRAGEFFAESLSSFEMALRGYQEANAKLVKVNESLECSNREFQELNQELDSFTYSVSHDLRAPVRVFTGYVRRLDESNSGRLDDEGRRCLSILATEAVRMGQQIGDLLEFSRLGRQQMQMSSIDMNGLVREIADEERRRSNSSALVISIESLPEARGDRELLRHVWQNLISNAIKYSSKRSDPVVNIGGEITGGDAVYKIQDNGAGFDMAYADKLFGAFQRMHRDSDYSGTGVGLAIVHRIVARHGGRVWADAHVGEGATFWFTLPLNGMRAS